MPVSQSQIQFLPEAQDDPQRRRPDIRKAKMLLGWEPVVSVTNTGEKNMFHELTIVGVTVKGVFITSTVFMSTVDEG